MKLFLIIECIIYYLLFIIHNDLIKYLGIIICFLYAIYLKKGYFVLCVILIADYFLLFTDMYIIGLLLFMIVQCIYHSYMKGIDGFYGLLCLLIYPSFLFICVCYAMMSICNIVIAIKEKHWLLIVLILLGLCDLCVAIQYVMHLHIPFIWYFYLPSQVYFIIKISSIKDETIEGV